ncbi:hypothetical protein V5799_017085 [Amblyomma americanum]|uniref:Uncharacterized protein n=1 Tax=Amblyomma americanum TaxID=6943 RepID=A0AAQ4F355_AMBAM
MVNLLDRTQQVQLLPRAPTAHLPCKIQPAKGTVCATAWSLLLPAWVTTGENPQERSCTNAPTAERDSNTDPS